MSEGLVIRIPGAVESEMSAHPVSDQSWVLLVEWWLPPFSVHVCSVCHVTWDALPPQLHSRELLYLFLHTSENGRLMQLLLFFFLGTLVNWLVLFVKVRVACSPSPPITNWSPTLPPSKSYHWPTLELWIHHIWPFQSVWFCWLSLLSWICLPPWFLVHPSPVSPLHSPVPPHPPQSQASSRSASSADLLPTRLVQPGLSSAQLIPHSPVLEDSPQPLI